MPAQAQCDQASVTAQEVRRYQDHVDGLVLVLLNVVHYNNNKNFGPTSPGVARDSFFLFSFYLFIHFINSIH
jgi:hypothetical protein